MCVTEQINRPGGISVCRRCPPSLMVLDPAHIWVGTCLTHSKEYRGLRRLAAVGIVASIVTVAVIYSRDPHNTTDRAGESAKRRFQQPKDRQQAEG